MVTLMTALYLAELRAEDRVSVKPHASPVLHAIEYLLGRLDRSYLTRLRDFGGLQTYPSRTKDPFPVDYSTGSVGLGSAAPLFGALADRFTQARLGASTGGRFISLLGDAELDEGNIWEALAEPLDAPARQRALDRRPEPAVARPRRPRHPGCRAGSAVPHERLGRDRAEVWPPAARGVGARGRRSLASANRRNAERAVSVAVRRERRGGTRDRSRRPGSGRAPAARAAARRLSRHRGAPRARPRRSRPRRRPRRPAQGTRHDRPADGDLRVHDQGLRPRDRRPAAEPLGAAHHRADRRLSPELRPHPRHRVGLVRRGIARAPSPRRSRRAPQPGRRSSRAPRRDSLDVVGPRSAEHLDAGGLRPHAARPFPRRRGQRAARDGRPTSRSRPTSAASSTRPASGDTTRSPSTTGWRTRL